MEDIYLKHRSDGQDILLVNGLPTLTGGLDNMIYMLLISGDYWGNTETDEDGTLDSGIPRIMAEGTLTNQTRLNIIEEAKRVTSKLVAAGIAERVEITGEIPRVGVMYLSARTFQPEVEEGIDFIYALNWELQKIGIINDEPERIQKAVSNVYISETGDTYVGSSGEIYVSDTYLI